MNSILIYKESQVICESSKRQLSGGEKYLFYGLKSTWCNSGKSQHAFQLSSYTQNRLQALCKHKALGDLSFLFKKKTKRLFSNSLIQQLHQCYFLPLEAQVSFISKHHSRRQILLLKKEKDLIMSLRKRGQKVRRQNWSQSYQSYVTQFELELIQQFNQNLRFRHKDLFFKIFSIYTNS